MCCSGEVKHKQGDVSVRGGTRDLLGPVKARVTQTLSGGHVTGAVKTVAAVVLTVIPVRPVGTTHLTPSTGTHTTGMS